MTPLEVPDATASRRRHTRCLSDWSSDVCSSDRSEEHTSELQSLRHLVCRLLLGVQTCALPTGESAITVLPNKEEFPWHLLLLPVNWTASPFWTSAGGSLLVFFLCKCATPFATSSPKHKTLPF